MRKLKLVMETKQKLIRKIEECRDERLLELISRWLDNYAARDYPDTFSEEKLAGVREGYEHYRQGKLYSAEHAEKLLEEWFKEK